MELKTPRFSTAIGSNLYAEDRVEYFSVFLVAIVIIIITYVWSWDHRRPDVEANRENARARWLVATQRVCVCQSASLDVSNNPTQFCSSLGVNDYVSGGEIAETVLRVILRHTIRYEVLF